MNAQSQYAFYGSLRRGMSNYEVYKEGLQYLFSTRLRGFKIFSMGDYPCAVESGNSTDSIVIEIFKITNANIERDIHDMELSVGYHFKNIEINHTNVGIYLYASSKNYPEVPGGDWVEFFRKNSES